MKKIAYTYQQKANINLAVCGLKSDLRCNDPKFGADKPNDP